MSRRQQPSTDVWAIRPPRWTGRQLVDLFVSQAVPLAAAFAGTLVTAQLLGPQGRGDLALVVGTANVVGALAFCSVHIGTARAVLRGDSDARSRVERWAAVLAGAGFLLALVIWWLVPSASSIGAFTRSTTAFAIAGGGLVAHNLVVLRTAQALGDFRGFRNAWLIQALLYPTLGIPVAAATRQPLLVAACWAIAVITSTIAILFHPRRPSTDDEVPRRTPKLRIVKESLPAHIAVVGQQMLLRADVVILGALSVSSSVGYYSVASAIAGMVSVVAEVASLLVLQRGMAIARLSKVHLLKAVYRLYAPIAAGAALVIGAATVVCLPIAMPNYAPAIPLAIVLLPGTVIQGFARIVLALISTERAPRLLLGFGVANTLLSACYAPAVIAAGAMGAALTSTLLYLAQSIMTMAIAIPILRQRDDERAMITPSINGGESTGG